MAGDGDGVRRRGPDSGSSEPSQPLQNGSTSEPSAERPLSTTQEALRYEPGVVRVRLTALRDIGAVLRSRYMEHIFRIACVALFLDICWVAWRSHSPTPIRELSSQYRDVTVGDACSWMYDELQWMGPIVLIVVGAFLMRRGKSVYLLDFALFSPPEGWKVSHEQICDMLRNTGKEEGSFTEQDVEFMTRVLSNSGTGDATAWPPGIVQCLSSGVRQNQSMDSARQEAEDVIGTCMENLFKETGVQPKEVDFLVINCSLFSPTPSLCAMACNKFNMRSSCRTYNLSGQGCSASLLSVDLASELLQNNPNSIAVVVSTELITQSLYHGHEKAMLLQNTLFRCGGARAISCGKPCSLAQPLLRSRGKASADFSSHSHSARQSLGRVPSARLRHELLYPGPCTLALSLRLTSWPSASPLLSASALLSDLQKPSCTCTLTPRLPPIAPPFGGRSGHHADQQAQAGWQGVVPAPTPRAHPVYR